MSELQHYADDLRRAYAGRSWQGPALGELLKGVTARRAARRPIVGAHTIWELVLHIAAWHGVVRARMQGKKVSLPRARNFPRVSKPSLAGWTSAQRILRESSEQTAEAILHFPAARLGAKVPSKNYNYRHMLSGVAHHDAYHAGQIALLKKAR